MRYLKPIVIVVILIISAGCIIPSLHPFYTEKDLVFDPNLIGLWDSPAGTWEFSKDGPNTYRLVYTDNYGRPGEFSVHLFRVRDSLFLDLYPEDPKLDGKKNVPYMFHFLQVHTLAYVHQIKPTLQVRVPESTWLEEFLAENPGAIQNGKASGQIVLTAEPKALQAFWLKHLHKEGAFSEPLNLKRKQIAVPETQPNRPEARNAK